MENEENRGLINKKTLEHQLVAFFQFSVRICLKEEKAPRVERKQGKERKGKAKKDREGTRR